MIKITLTSSGSNAPQLFEKQSIIVGPPGVERVDYPIKISAEAPNSPWIEIFSKDTSFRVVNLAGSPLIKLNGNEFAEGEIPSGGIIKLFDSEIKIESEAEQSLFLDLEETVENFELDESFDLDKELEKLGAIFDKDESPSAIKADFTEKEFEEFIASAEKIEIKEEVKALVEEKINLETVKLEFTNDALDPSLTSNLFDEENPLLSSMLIENNNVHKTDAPSRASLKTEESSELNQPQSNSRDSINTDSRNTESISQTNQRNESETNKLKNSPFGGKIGRLSSSAEFFFDSTDLGPKKDVGVHIEQQWAEIQDKGNEEQIDQITQDAVDFHQGDVKIGKSSSFLSTVALAVMVLLIFLGCGGVGSIYYIQKQNTEIQLRAALATADCAMAFIYAKANHLDIYHENILDGDFLNDSLTNLLPGPYREQSPIGRDGKIEQIGYEFKIFTTDNFSRFILVAKPINSFSQWLVPNIMILVDSNELELKRSKRISEWTEFLESRSDLAMLNQTRLEKMLSLEEIIPLQVLSQSNTNLGFSVPRDLIYRNPQGKNLVYNAPRYRQVTSKIVAELISSTDEELDSGKAIKLTDSLRYLSELRHFVFYTDVNTELARKGLIGLQKQLRKPILLGQVELNDNGLINKIEVMESDQYSDFTYQTQWGKKTGQVTEEVAPGEEVTARIDVTHPLHITIIELASQRQAALKAVKDKILALLEDHTKKESPDFYNQYKTLLDEFELVSQKQRKKIEKVLDNLYNDYVVSEPKEQYELFVSTVKMAELEDFLPTYLRAAGEKPIEKADAPKTEATTKDVEAAIKTISETKNFVELHDTVLKTSNCISIYNSKNSDDEERLKTQFRREVLNKVGELLLSPEYAHTPQLFQDENRTLLSESLNLANITEIEERNFYLNEFDLLMVKFRNVVHSDLRYMQKQKNYIDAQLEDKEDLVPFEVVELEEKKKALDKEIAGTREEMTEIKNQITHIPLSTRVHKQEEYKGTVGRLGQQIIIQVSLEPPSNERDEKLKEAINLLYQATEDDRSLWGDILEARRLITQNPEIKIREILESEIGFSHKVKNPLPTQVRNLLKDYVESYQELLVTKDPRKYEALFESFSQRQRKNLQDVITISKEIVDKSKNLASSLDEYIARLEEFAADYNKSKDEGFFVTARAYHQAMASRLNQKLASSQHLRGNVRGVVQHLIQSSEEHRELAEEELLKLDTTGGMDPDSGYVLLKRNQNMRFPNLIAENLDSRVNKIFRMDVYPLPQ